MACFWRVEGAPRLLIDGGTKVTNSEKSARALETLVSEIVGMVEEGNHERNGNELYEEIDSKTGPIWRPRGLLCIVIVRRN